MPRSMKFGTVLPWLLRSLEMEIFRTIQNQHYLRLLLFNKRDWPFFKKPFLSIYTRSLIKFGLSTYAKQL